MAQQSGTARRALRDLLPATLATGAVGLAVALVVGGTGAAVRSVVGPGRGDAGSSAVAELAGDAVIVPGADGPAGVTVRVRPTRPPASSVASVLDLVPSAVSTSSAVGSAAEPAVVRGLLLDRTSAPPLPAPAPVVLAEAVAPAPTVAVAVAVPTTTPTTGGGATRPERGRSTPKSAATTRKTAPVTLASTDRVALDGSGSVTTAKTDDRDAATKRNGPPDHAPAIGYRTR